MAEKMKSDFGKLVSQLAQTHVELWHEEDNARSPHDPQVAQAKRRIDQLNQKRNDLIEQIDLVVLRAIKQARPAPKRGLKNG